MEVRVAVRLENSLVIHDTIGEAWILEELAARAGTSDFRAAILAAA